MSLPRASAHGGSKGNHQAGLFSVFHSSRVSTSVFWLSASPNPIQEVQQMHAFSNCLIFKKFTFMTSCISNNVFRVISRHMARPSTLTLADSMYRVEPGHGPRTGLTELPHEWKAMSVAQTRT